MLSAENQVSEQEMDEVIARSTYQESKEANSSPGLGMVMAQSHSPPRRDFPVLSGTPQAVT